MSSEEFLYQFDLLYNNVGSNQAPGLNSYEKSVFLTKAQDEILKSYFNPRLNKTQEGFDDSSLRQIDFLGIITSNSTIDVADNIASFPTNVFIVLNETVLVTRDGEELELAVIPISYEEWTAIKGRAYRRPPKYQAWRIIQGTSNLFIAGSKDIINTYTIRYLRKPKPIILESLSEYGIKIEGQSEPNNPVCELNPVIHEEILQRAVELAKAAYQGGLETQLALGVNSETNMGIVPQSK